MLNNKQKHSDKKNSDTAKECQQKEAIKVYFTYDEKAQVMKLIGTGLKNLMFVTLEDAEQYGKDAIAAKQMVDYFRDFSAETEFMFGDIRNYNISRDLLLQRCMLSENYCQLKKSANDFNIAASIKDIVARIEKGNWHKSPPLWSKMMNLIGEDTQVKWVCLSSLKSSLEKIYNTAEKRCKEHIRKNKYLVLYGFNKYFTSKSGVDIQSPPKNNGTFLGKFGKLCSKNSKTVMVPGAKDVSSIIFSYLSENDFNLDPSKQPDLGKKKPDNNIKMK